LSHNEGICDKRIGKGPEGRQGALALKKIRIEAPTYVKVLCIVYTHSNRHHVLQSIVETWGSRCSGFLAASNKTDKKVGAVDLSHLGNESYQSMYQKVRSIWAYVHRHYLMKYDFFFIGGDDVFVIAENLKHSLKDYDPDKTPLYLGGAMTRHPLIRKRYCGGGSGYVLNRACLRVLVEQMFDKPECRPLEIRSDEDVIISDCLRPIVNCTHSVDEHDETRFHPLSAQFHASWAYPTSANWFPQLLLKHSNITATMKPMLESVSETSVSFHLVLESQFAQLTAPATNFSDKGMRRYHALLFNLCENLSLSNWTPRVRRKQRADPH
jgi:glycoprotein-N-acetylgalactosamine 3-beta-galactosyltransferase